MFPRLWLKTKKLDKFDYLDKTSVVEDSSFFCEEWNLSRTNSAEVVQKKQMNHLAQVLFFEWIVSQKSLKKHDKNNRNIFMCNSLRGLKLYTVLDIFINSLFLLNSLRLTSTKNVSLININKVNGLDNLLSNFKSTESKVLLDNNFTIQISVKNPTNTDFYKKLNKESSSIG